MRRLLYCAVTGHETESSVNATHTWSHSQVHSCTRGGVGWHQRGIVRQILGKAARAPSNGVRQISSGGWAPVKFRAVGGPHGGHDGGGASLCVSAESCAKCVDTKYSTSLDRVSTV